MTAPPGAPLPLDPTVHELTRRIVLEISALGVEVTRAIENAGHGEISSNTDVAVLGALAIHGRLRPRALLGPTRLTRGGLSNLLERLESAELVHRTYGNVAHDRRGATVGLTAQGDEVVSQAGMAAARSLVRQQPVLAELVRLLQTVGRARRERTDALSPVAQLDLIGRLGALLMDALASVEPEDPSPGKTLVVLSSAAGPERTRPRELIDRTGLSSGGVTLLLGRLEKGGLIVRRSDVESDRRAVVVELTDRGGQLLERQLTQVLSQIGPMRDGFTDLLAATRTEPR